MKPGITTNQMVFNAERSLFKVVGICLFIAIWGSMLPQIWG